MCVCVFCVCGVCLCACVHTHTYNGEAIKYYLALNKKKIQAFITTWMNLGNVLKIYQDILFDINYTWNLKHKNVDYSIYWSTKWNCIYKKKKTTENLQTHWNLLIVTELQLGQRKKKKEIKDFQVFNENEFATYPKLWKQHMSFIK